MATERNGRRPENNGYKGQQVVYTPAKPFRRSRLILQLLTVFALVLAIFMGISVFFKVERIEVTGAEKHSVEAIAAASGIEKGDSLFFFGRAGAYSRIKTQLAYVNTVRFGIELPGTVKIYVEEVPVVYAIQDKTGSWWLMDADGRITEQGSSVSMKDCTQILGVYLEDPRAGSMAVAAEPAVTEPDPEAGEEQVPVVNYESDKLAAALEIARQLEANEILGKVTQVDVSNHQELKFQYEGRILVELGSNSRLDYKIAMVKSAIHEIGELEMGTLDASMELITDGFQFKPKD